MNEKEKKLLINIAEKCGPVMQEGLSEALDALFDDNFPKTREDVDSLLSGKYEDLPTELKEHLEAWVIFIIAKSLRTYKEDW